MRHLFINILIVVVIVLLITNITKIVINSSKLDEINSYISYLLKRIENLELRILKLSEKLSYTWKNECDGSEDFPKWVEKK